MGDDLVAFLRARLGEDEKTALIATGCSEDGRYDARSWRVADGEVTGDDGTEEGIDVARARWEDPGIIGHIARHDPARVLREVEAKRRIIDLHSGAHECSTFEDNCTWIDAEFNRLYCDTLRLLALPYDQHPNYDEAWKP